ncbi:hypothetical protein C8R43DRAFT_906289, partial [Mycena crocata]
MTSETSLLPVFSKGTPFSDWRSDAKAHLRRKEVFACCITASDDAVAKEKCAGILWGMLSKDVKPLVKQHEDDPKALWEALESIFAPRKAGARFNAYKTLTSICLREEESLLSLTGRVSAAIRLLKDSRTKSFTLDNADEELQAVVLLMALPDDGQYAVLKAPFEQSPDDLKVSVIEQAYANHQAFRTAHQEGDTSQISPLSGLAMAATSFPSPAPPSSSAALAAAPPAPVVPCQGCGKAGHALFQCFKFLDLIGKPRPNGKGAAATPQVAANASVLSHSALALADKRWNSDSGTTSHMTNDRARLFNAWPYRVPIQVANGVVVYSELVGETLLRPLVNGRPSRFIILTHVLYVPLLSHNL